MKKLELMKAAVEPASISAVLYSSGHLSSRLLRKFALLNRKTIERHEIDSHRSHVGRDPSRL